MHKVCTDTPPTYFTQQDHEKNDFWLSQKGQQPPIVAKNSHQRILKTFAFYGAKSDVVDASGFNY